MSPSDEIELRNMVATCAAFDDGPTVLRYPSWIRNNGPEKLQELFGYELENGEIPSKGKFGAILLVSALCVHFIFIHLPWSRAFLCVMICYS